jgi:hypothetical protein
MACVHGQPMTCQCVYAIPGRTRCHDGDVDGSDDYDDDEDSGRGRRARGRRRLVRDFDWSSSHNPNTHKALFVAPITDTRNPNTTPYVRITGYGITQTIRFRPTDALHFKVFLPDGSPFQPLLADNPPPLPPNKYLQISAVFSIRRVPS